MREPRFLILGATGGPGLGTFLNLARRGADVVGIGRSADRVRALNNLVDAHALRGRVVEMNLVNPTDDLAILVQGATVLISASHPHFATHCLKQAHRFERVVAVSSIRVFSKYPHPLIPLIAELRDVIEGGPVPGVLLLTTMQTGGVGYNNLERLAKFAQLSPVVPLPKSAASALVQPVHTDDVVYCMLRSLTALPDERVLALGGPEQMSYSQLIKRVASAVGRRVWTPSVPDRLVLGAAAVLNRVPGAPRVSSQELQRAAEDKVCDPSTMARHFGRQPRAIRYVEPERDYAAALDKAFANLGSEGME